ncbi:MAG: Ig-like domain-containing protein [Mycobacterium sp.]
MTATLWGLSVASPEISIASAEDGTPSSSTGSDRADASDAKPTSDSSSVTRASGQADDSEDAQQSDDADVTKTMRHSNDSFSSVVAEADSVAADAEKESSTVFSAGDESALEASDAAITDGRTEVANFVEPTFSHSEDSSSVGFTQSDTSPTRAVAAALPSSGATEPLFEATAPIVTATTAVTGAGDVEELPSNTEILTPKQSVVVSVNSPNDGRQWVAQQIAALVGTANSFISVLPVADPFKLWLYESVAGTRRALFNQAPWVNPIQVSGEGTLPIVGQLQAVDLEGDAIHYAIVSGPASGTVEIDAEGRFVYTPNTGYTGVDAFVISATDLGPHFNLLDPFRSASSLSSLLVNQNAVTFLFNYTTGSQYWTPEARIALQQAASNLVGQFIVTNPVVLTYQITGQNSSSTNTLASAESALIGAGVGFFPTVVQHKLLTGIDSNGTAADGEIDWNFAFPWAFGDYVSELEYDFTTVAMHEFMHSFGFMSYVQVSTTETRRTWTIYDSFLRTADGTRLIGSDSRFNLALSATLTGANGGVYFGGVGAVDAYGGTLVPLYAPDPWVEGSSISHLDGARFTGVPRQLMYPQVPAGTGARTLSAIERGIMRDLGYTLAPVDVTSVLACVGFVFLRRRRFDER